MKKLILNLRKEYFEQIRTGEKVQEFREVKEYWTKRLSKIYDVIEIRMGYPKNDEKEKIMCFEWNGFEEKSITHKEFGSEPIHVYAINLNKRIY